MKKGCHIVLEGPDGAGKTTVGIYLARYLDHYAPTGFYRNPGATPLGVELRALVKTRKDIEIDKYTTQVLMAADYCCFQNTIVKPSLEAGKIVVSDRSNLISGLVYSLAGEISLKQIDLFQNVILACDPPLVHVILLYADYDELLKRRHGDGEKECKIEALGEEFHRKVCSRYNQIKMIADAGYRKAPLAEHLDWSTNWSMDIETRLRNMVEHKLLDAQYPWYSIWPVNAASPLAVVQEECQRAADQIVANSCS